MKTELVSSNYCPVVGAETYRVELGDWKVFGRKNKEKNKAPTPAEEPAAISEDDIDHSEVQVYAQNLWWEYLLRSAWKARGVRVGTASFLYLAIGFAVILATGIPSSPARGKLARDCDVATIAIAVLASTILTFYVLDAIYLDTRFIQYLMVQHTYYPQDFFSQYQADFKLDDENLTAAQLTEYADIQFIAKRTRKVGEIIYYPFVVFFLMLFARSALFADWDWPAGLVVVLGFNIFLALVSAVILRRVAERARKIAVQRISRRAWRLRRNDAEPAAKFLEELVERVRNERGGAFSVLSNHPIFAAILLPGGSIGLWALIEGAIKLIT